MALPATETTRASQDTEALYREHGAAVAALCRSLLRDRSEAEDATQQAFLSVHRALLNGAAPREPLPWLLAVARNECYARFRQRATAPLPGGDAPESATADASTHALRADELAEVWDEVGQMPSAQRKAFLLREIRGLSYAQLAAELSLSPPSVRSLLLRARTRLRHRLRDVTLGAAPWVQALLRLAGGGDGASPLPAATKAAAVGLGTLALASGGDAPRDAHHPPAAPRPAPASHRSAARTRHDAPPTAFAAARREDRLRTDDSGSERAHPRRREEESGSGPSRGRRGTRGRDDSAGSSSARGGPGPSSETTTGTSGSDGSGRDGSSDRSGSSDGAGSSHGGSGGSDGGRDG